jgi:8-amino-7-oxononanoate synthase
VSRARVLDFTTALYLGLRHPSDALAPWARLTTGVPAALREPRAATAVGAAVAALQGCERGAVAASTLHLAWDLMGMLAGEGTWIYLDAAS